MSATAPDLRPAVAAGRLTALQGTAIYLGAVLGTGVIALPALAAEVAGPASLIAWLLMSLLSAPLAATFAALGARYPDAGGLATYTHLAFGDAAAAVVGWWSYLAIPTGGVAATLFCGTYVAAVTGGGRMTAVTTAAVIMLLVATANMWGVTLAGSVQLVLAGLLLLLLVVAVVTSVPHASTANLTPFAPHGWYAIGPAASLLVWSFAGWEAVTHLTAEFRDPRRDVPRATAAAVVAVGLLYLALAAAVITVLGPAAARSEVPLGDLLSAGLGGPAHALAAVAALLFTVGNMNAYYAGASKLGAALGRDGALPAWLAKGSRTGEAPRRSLLVLLTGCALTLGVVAVLDVSTTLLVQATSGIFLAVYGAGVAAAFRLLRGHAWARLASVLSLASILALLIVSGPFLLWPAGIAAAALLYRWLRRRTTRTGRPAANPARTTPA
jgi:amino acid efflux transporter